MLILSKILVMPCFEITSVWRGYHILIYYVIQCAYAYINPGVYKTHKVFLFIKCPWKILGLRILSDIKWFRTNIYSFENIIGSNINGCDTLKMECYEGIIFLHIVTRFWLIKWNTLCVDILNICMSYDIMFIQKIVTRPPTPPPPPPPRERCIQIGICFHFR